MKKTFLFAAFALSALTLSGTSGLSVTCVDGVTQSGNCAAGRVTFAGTQYSSSSHVWVVRNSNNAQYDNWDYDAQSGALTFTETLTPAGTYTITVTNGSTTEQYTVVTGN